MNKEQLINKLISLRYQAYYNIFSQQALHEYFKILHKSGAEPFPLPGLELIDGSRYQLSEFITEMNAINDKALLETKRNANRFITRNMLKEVFRVSQSFAKDNHLNDLMRNQDWYEYTRVIVNTMSHSGVLDINFEQSMQKKLPIIYKNHQITESMHGQPIPITMDLLYEITESIISWVNTI
jgi:hypothetical protein